MYYGYPTLNGLVVSVALLVCTILANMFYYVIHFLSLLHYCTMGITSLLPYTRGWGVCVFEHMLLGCSQLVGCC